MPSQHGSYQVEEHEAMNGSASLPIGTWFPLLSESSTTARKTIYCDAKVQEVPFVKEFGEGFDRICREQEANGANVPSFRTDEFILKITVSKVAEKVTVNVTEKVNATENVIDASQKTSQKTSQKIIELIKEDPYISTTKMAEIIGVDRRNIARNIKKLQEQGVVRRVGPDKGGFWEVIV